MNSIWKVLFLGVSYFGVSEAWPIATTSQGGAIFMNPNNCPYYDSWRNTCISATGYWLNTANCDCLYWMLFQWVNGASETVSTLGACKSACNSNSQCTYYGLEVSGDPPVFTCWAQGDTCSNFRTGLNNWGYVNQQTMILHSTTNAVTMPNQNPPSISDWDSLRANCAPRCPEVHTVWVYSGGSPASQSYASQAVGNWTDCLQYCVNHVQNTACQWWTYLPKTQQVADLYGAPTQGMCYLFTQTVGDRTQGVIDAMSGTRFAGIQNCSATCVMSMWSDWTSCSTSCGGGSITRSRSVLTQATVNSWYDTYVQANLVYSSDGDCGAASDSQQCNNSPCPIPCAYGDWSQEWGSWVNSTSACSATCGGGWAQRSRPIVTQPANGAPQCNPASQYQNMECNTDACPGCYVTEWGPWSQCSTTCEIGNITRVRSPSDPTTYVDGCAMLNQTSQCITLDSNGDQVECPRNCSLSAEDWTSWSACTASCDAGYSIRTRDIEAWQTGAGLACGTSGPGYDFDFQQGSACNVQVCPVDCEVSEWSTWSTCSLTCGTGYSYQTRYVTSPPQGAGAVCPSLYQQQNCQLVLCGVPPGSCFTGNTAYLGTNSLVTNTTTVQECQTSCQSIMTGQGMTCVGFTFAGETGECYLKMDVTSTVSNASTMNYISGPPECPPTNNATSVAGPGEGVPVGVIVGASVGGLVAIALLGGGVYYFTKKTGEEPEAEPTYMEDDEDYDYSATDGDQVYVGTKDYAEESQADEEPDEY